MAYADFTPRDLVEKFGVRFSANHLFGAVNPIEPTEWLTTTLKMGRNLGFSTEKSRSERLVTPVLLELSNRNQNSFSIYSGSNLDVDESLGLRGECDFIFSLSRIQDFVTAPIFCISEAKKQDLERGTIQAAAQLIGAKKLNEIESTPIDTLYGCSTTGLEWRFLKYIDNEIIIDETRYLLTELSSVLGILQHIIDVSRKS